jgi:hypothetical protein
MTNYDKSFKSRFPSASLGPFASLRFHPSSCADLITLVESRRSGQSAFVRKISLNFGMIALLMVFASVTSGAPTANELLTKAREKAAKESKAIFVDFSASW